MFKMQLIAKIPLQELVSNKLVRAYLEKNPLLNSLVDYFPDKQAFKSVMENKSKFFRHRENLVEALLEQNKNAGAKVLENIRLLKENNTYTVTTGHQLCVLGGPAYFFHKIIHTVKLAQELAHHFPENNFVPVFWMASEDHDFEEISKLYVYGKEIKWQREANNEPVGQLSLEKIDEVFNELNEIFQNDAHALNIIKELREAYAKGQNLSESTRNFVQFFFEKYGVVIIDAHHKLLKKCFSPYLNKEVKSGVLNKSISVTNDFLIKNGFKIQAKARNLNLFYLENGKRYRLELLEDEKITLVGGDKFFTKSEMMEQVERHPERFSPNVLMRPVYQEVILPNIAYIGGSGEIAYWLQLKDVFKEFQVPFPLLMVRNSIFYVPPSVNRIMNKYDLKITDFFRSDLHKLLNRIVLRHSDFNIEEEKNAIEREFQKIKEKVLNIDKSLEAFLKGESVKLHKQLENIEKKALKAEKRHHETMNKQLEKVYQILFPEDQWQERVESFLPYYFKNKNIIDDLITQTKSLESNMYVFEV